MSEFEGEVNLGKLGEEEFSRWCTAAKLVANRSLEEDTNGWDHLIEFPYLKFDGPRDKQPKPIECKVQVKSTQRTDGGVNIKLSALKRLVDYTSPTFIVFYEYDDSDAPVLENSYLVHVDKTLIYRVLKKIRENDLLDKPEKLNHIKLWVNYNDSLKLSRNDGEALRDKIMTFVPGGIVKYQQDKHVLTETVGYEDGGYQFRFNAVPDELEDYLMKRALGVAKSLNIKDTIMLDTRFQLEGINVQESQEAEIELLPQREDLCKLRFKTAQYSPAISFDAELVKVPSILERSARMLFKTNLFSIEFGSISSKGIERVTFHGTLDNKASLDDCIGFFKVFNPENSDNPLILEIDMEKYDSPLIEELCLSHKYGDFIDLAHNLRFLQSGFEIDNSLLVNIKQLVEEKSRIRLLCDLLRNDAGRIKFKYPDVPENERFRKQDEAKHLFTTMVNIGGSSFGVVALLHARYLKEFEYHAYSAEILDTISLHQQAPTQELLEELEQKAFKRLELDQG
ncbi:hypothetical protein A3K86_18540 [Photobacterium jeanii]|uniref:DUF4365 domain-containing protein n=1 Tax=Photobacterium jeanii TaxID=858640 RepID=A0A178K0X3_9GAMM|nr:hypothetical protein [Photobacterium jeanii]OAN10979.1 hypothetical protein A3K86_18540 [Photobacterium jeanii]PST90495.1 hypothetical protein C9I91_07640 [Photobacterium jeanii]